MNWNEKSEETLLAMKRKGLSNEIAAKRFAVSKEEIEEKLADIARKREFDTNTMSAAYAQFTQLCNQYDELGESLKFMAHVLSDRATKHDISIYLQNEFSLPKSHAQDIADKLFEEFLILNSKDVQVFYESSSEDNQQGGADG